MKTCKDCLHEKVCCIKAMPSAFENTKWEKEPCDHFKDKSRYIELPINLNTTVYCIAQPCGGCECFNEVMCEEFLERCRNCTKTEIIECKFDYELIPDFGKTAFLTREDAQRALEELKTKEK